MLAQQGLKRRSHLFCSLSVILNLLAVLTAVVCVATALFVYIFLTSHG